MWVLFPIADGDFIMGDASEDLLFPEHLMNDGEVVVVTVNYRVGPFGWLCLENEKAPGNLVEIIQLSKSLLFDHITSPTVGIVGPKYGTEVGERQHSGIWRRPQ